jgi:hypothetical protein
VHIAAEAAVEDRSTLSDAIDSGRAAGVAAGGTTVAAYNDGGITAVAYLGASGVCRVDAGGTPREGADRKKHH